MPESAMIRHRSSPNPLLCTMFICGAVMLASNAQADETWTCAWNGSDGKPGLSEWRLNGSTLTNNNHVDFQVILNTPARLVATNADFGISPDTRKIAFIEVISMNRATGSMKDLLFDTKSMDGDLPGYAHGPPFYAPSKTPGIPDPTVAPPDLTPTPMGIGVYVASQCTAK